ncbi:hypothetical protein FHS55_003918 [Angulomicrobium tetraedrale]|uniref:Uncharacterized protein n=1 Tax=Ancylobacter tetraedralis TaxID=217068 RepID=A0A839ZF94_9HYPH|nr:hypothetical protein [Ancylobacter tetraedralis]MBB3773285.1 hypothetical protein [Ancylobacter tetraedralis]
MRRSISDERAALSLPGMPAVAGARTRAGTFALAFGVLLAGGLLASPAGAQWIGTPGGTGEAAATAPTIAPTAAPAPTSVAVPAATPAPAVAPSEPSMSGGMPGAVPDGFAGGFAPAPGGMAPAPQAGPNSADVADCQSNVTKLRDDLESRNDTLRKAADKKVPPSELCPLFRNFVTAQQKFYNYLNTNKTKCGVPGEVLTGLKKNSGQVAGIRDKVCKAAQLEKSGGGGPPPQGALSSGLGLSSGLPPTGTAKGGVFDTLAGDALR